LRRCFSDGYSAAIVFVTRTFFVWHNLILSCAAEFGCVVFSHRVLCQLISIMPVKGKFFLRVHEAHVGASRRDD